MPGARGKSAAGRRAGLPVPVPGYFSGVKPAAPRRLVPVLALACVLASVAGCSATGGAAPDRPAPPPASYYLSLGDSLSQGVQPNAAGVSVATPHGYADLLYASLRRRQPGLRLVKLGCSGETTATMIKGGICRYSGGSQLAAAVRFLRANRGRVRLVTLDIGANDPDACLTEPSFSKLAACVRDILPHAAGNLSTILSRLRQADPHGRIIAMNYYLPALAQWRNGVAGETIARVTEVAAAGYNGLLTDTYQGFGIRVADVFSAFHTSDFGHPVTMPGYGRLPRNVAAICQWTWACAPPPRGPNQHANRAGYEVIAGAFRRAGAG